MLRVAEVLERAAQFRHLPAFIAGEALTGGRTEMFKRIDHVEIVTDRPEETERFYTEIHGSGSRRVTTSYARAKPEASSCIYLDLGGTTVELIAYEEVPVEPAPHVNLSATA